MGDHSGIRLPIESNGSESYSRVPTWLVIALVLGGGVFSAIGGGVVSQTNDPKADIAILKNQVTRLEALAESTDSRIVSLRDDLNRFIVELRVLSQTKTTVP